MMLKPSIDKLLDKVNSKYSLVILASKRAHELETGAKRMKSEYLSVKNVGRALEEIEEGRIVKHSRPEIKRERIRREFEIKRSAERRERDRIQQRIENEHGPLL